MADFTLRDMQDVSLYKLSWGARLCWTRRLLVCPVRLPFSPFIRPVGPSLIRRDFFPSLFIPSLLGPLSASVGLTTRGCR